MKKFLILVALLATSTLCWAKPTLHNMSAVKTVDNFNTRAKTLAHPTSALDNFNLNSKDKENFQAEVETEIIRPIITEGQVFEAGSQNNYGFTYDPISKVMLGISARRGWSGTDSVFRTGIIRAVPYEKGKRLTAIIDTMWHVGYPYKGGQTPVDVAAYDWFYPSIVVANPTNTEDITQLKISVATQYIETPAFTTASTALYNYFGVASTANLLDTNVRLDVEYVAQGAVWVNEAPYHILNQPLKGQVAYFNGTPYAVYFGKVLQSIDPATSPMKYALISIDLSKDDISFEKVQFLPKSVEDIFGTSILTPNNRLYTEMNIDYDKNNNIYLAFNGSIANIFNDGELSKSFKELPIPVVIKVPYESTGADVITASAQVDSMPYQLISDYIEKEGGIWDLVGNPPYMGASFTDCGDDVPFVVYGEDSYSFVTSIEYDLGNTTAIDVVEINKSDGKWSMRKIYDASDTWFHRYLLSSEQPNVALWESNEGISAFIYGIFDDYGRSGRPDAAANAGKLYLRDLYTYTHDLQISKTADGQYLIAKWRQADKRKGVTIPTIESFIQVQIAPPESERVPWLETMNEAYYSEMYLSYRHIDDDKWSIPVVAADKMHDSISFWGTFMPRIVPSVDEVLISYAYADQQNELQTKIPKLMAYNYYSYTYTGVICPSAITGPQYVKSIKEEGPATANNLDVFPNPATTTTNFRFSLLKPGNTKLSVTNVLGQEMAVVVDEFCDANNYSIDYDVSDLPRGIYYFTLTSGAFVQTKAFVVK
jgi:hypothetical protein